jgi:hypothetical protein
MPSEAEKEEPNSGGQVLGMIKRKSNKSYKGFSFSTWDLA